jgi:hypothetical protein
MKDNIIMVVAELEDGREHIHAKQNKPEKYDLNNKNDLKILKDVERLYVKDKELCYSKDLTMIHSVKNSDKDAIVLVNKLRYEPYDENLHIPYRTYSVWFRKQSQEKLN